MPQPLPKHDFCPGDGQPCWNEAGVWRCSTSQCGRQKVPANRGRKRELDGQSGLPRFSPYAIPAARDPKAVDCPYCVRRPRNLKAHCQAMHPDKPEAR